MARKDAPALRLVFSKYPRLRIKVENLIGPNLRKDRKLNKVFVFGGWMGAVGERMNDSSLTCFWIKTYGVHEFNCETCKSIGLNVTTVLTEDLGSSIPLRDPYKLPSLILQSQWNLHVDLRNYVHSIHTTYMTVQYYCACHIHVYACIICT